MEYGTPRVAHWACIREYGTHGSGNLYRFAHYRKESGFVSMHEAGLEHGVLAGRLRLQFFALARRVLALAC